MRSLATILITGLILFGVWYSVPTRVFVEPLSLRYDGEKFIYIRATKYGSVWGRFLREVRSELGTCNEAAGAFYEDIGLTPVSYRAPAMEACIPGKGEVFILTVRRSAVLGGWFLVRPSTSTWSCEVGGPECAWIK